MKFSYTKKTESDFFYNESKSNKKNSGGWEGRAGGVARVSDLFFFFQKNPSLKKKCFSTTGGEGKG